MIDYDEESKSYQMLFTEDIINKEEKLPNYQLQVDDDDDGSQKGYWSHMI